MAGIDLSRGTHETRTAEIAAVGLTVAGPSIH